MMKHTNIPIKWLCLLILLFTCHHAQAQGISKNINIGYLYAKVVDSGDEGEGSWGWGMSPTYYDGFGWRGIFSSKAVFLGCKNWTDTLGISHGVKLSGHGQWECDDLRIMMPVPDEDGWTIHKYLRYQPPEISVDGLRMDDPFPFNLSDHVAPDKIPGTADVMVESWFNTDMGVTVHQRVFAFSQKNHDDYQIYEWTFKNTGNVDLDDDIELPGQTIKDFYFLRQIRQQEDPPGWVSSYGEMPGDTLRILYGYPQRQEGANWDNFGDPSEIGYIQAPFYVAEAILFASKDVNDMITDDENQPSMTGYHDCDFEPVTRHSLNLDDTKTQNLYKIMSEGFNAYDGQPEMIDAKPGHHSVRFDEQGYKFATDFPHYGYTMSSFYACGPYTLEFGDSIKIVWAQVEGMIDSETGWEVGQAWLNGTIQPPEGMSMGSDNLPPVYDDYPELYKEDDFATKYSNWAKDCWVATGKDSLFRNATAAQWAYDNGLNIPQPPPAPSIAVTSMPNSINIEWGDESEAAADFAGYRVYRAIGYWAPIVPEDETEFMGGWELIFESAGKTVHAYTDTTARRGFAYYYCVTAFDNGQENVADFDGKVRSLESSMFANMTKRAAYLTRPASADLSDVIIVPNPYNISASILQYTGEPNKIMFLNLPIKCTIRIYTESGDLVQKIEHFGSGDESWGKIQQEHLVTLSDQLIVSGIYIAHIETPDGKSAIKKFVVVR